MGDVSQLSEEDVLALFPHDEKRILVGCAPCQPFSKYTKRHRKDGHANDKWKLLYSFLEFIEVSKPYIVSMENVPELVAEKVFFDFIFRLEQKGYHCSWSVAFCPDYGAVYGRMKWNEPSPTMTTQFYGYGNGRFGHPEQDRAISYHECSLFQSFPKEYLFVENGQAFNRRELGTHIGNAVPVKLG